MTAEQILEYGPFVLAFIIGSFVGSFLNVAIHRLPNDLSVWRPVWSFCPKCGETIAWHDNIPIVSYLALGARCRNCAEWISPRYLAIELLTALLFLGVYWRYGFTFASPVYMLLAAGLVLVTAVDLTNWTIPNEVTLPGIPAGIVLALIATFRPDAGLVVLGPGLPVFSAIIGLIVGGGSLLLLDRIAVVFLGKRGMGMGDVKLLAMLGAFFGWPAVIMIIMISSLIGSVVGIGAVLWAKRKAKSGTTGESSSGDDDITLEEHYLPFGPYLCLAGLIIIFFGEQLYNGYLQHMGLAGN